MENVEHWYIKAPVFTDDIGEIWNQYPFGLLSTKVLFTLLTDDPDSMRSCRWWSMCTDDLELDTIFCTCKQNIFCYFKRWSVFLIETKDSPVKTKIQHYEKWQANTYCPPLLHIQALLWKPDSLWNYWITGILYTFPHYAQNGHDFKSVSSYSYMACFWAQSNRYKQ